MKTPQEFNQEYLEKFSKREKSGLKCPICSTEMEFPDRIMLASFPPMRKIVCPKCEHRDTVYC